MQNFFLSNYLQPHGLVFDIGAHKGIKTDFYLACGARVVCFEPQSEYAELLAAKYNGNPNVVIIGQGVASEEGILQLSICKEAGVLSTFSERWQKGRFADFYWSDPVEVAVTTLDRAIATFGTPQFCKIDVEGFELEVLKGLSEPIPSLSFEFVKEFPDATQKCIQHLQQLGYQAFNFISGENLEMALPYWVDGNTLLEILQQIEESDFWGDIYAIAPEVPKPLLLTAGENWVLDQLVSDRGVVFDIGANVGAWTQSILYRHPNLQIHLFEPTPVTYQKLLRNLARSFPNCLSAGQLLCHHLAISNQEAILPLYTYSQDSGLNTLYRRSQEVELTYALNPPNQVNVLTTTLDSYCDRTGIHHIHFVKIDVEGAELNVLQGAKSLLQRGSIDYLQFEYGGTYADAGTTLEAVFDLFNQYNYFLFAIQPTGLEWIPVFMPELENYEYSNFLAVNERLSPLLSDEEPQMLDLDDLFQKHQISPRGVIHIGAHEGQELVSYSAMGITPILLIEANPNIFEDLQIYAQSFANRDKITCVNCAISNTNGMANFHITSYDQSSSLLPLKQHREIYPTIEEVAQIEVPLKTLDTLLEELDCNPSLFNILNIDIQGAELLALQGAIKTLACIEAINIEVSYVELYAGGAFVWEIDRFLEQYGFERVATTSPLHPSWGDALYVRCSESRTN
ncbi:FkbM family methyltransferase [Tumidithrix elongata RA019]|uniref:FkbM family methyltransferase n=1 Tax=Tumidithrix elongata BACA0141 TaxID=2716417 RepID=A0AAW9PXA5_9CYAN|nr:FkbM family methyltransferase [Tumidithrix elongata RA019]